MNIRKFLSPEDLKRIEEAVKAAEARTGGEIVPLVAAESDAYPEVPWRGGFVALSLVWAAALALTLAGVSLAPADLFRLWGGSVSPLTGSPVPFLVLTSAAAFIAGFFLSLLPPVRRLFVTRTRSAGEVRQAALESFLDNNIHLTKGHTGILIYLSLFERRVEIIADKGINDALSDKGTWDGIAAELVTAIRGGKAGEGLVQAVERCGSLLEKAVPRAADDTNELPDGVRFK